MVIDTMLQLSWGTRKHSDSRGSDSHGDSDGDGDGDADSDGDGDVESC